MAARPAVDGEPKTELTEQDIRELECPEVACAVDALMDFMECFPETWGRKPRGSIVPLVPRHYGSEWLHEYLRSFLCVPYFVEAPEIRAWLLHVGILSAQKGHPTTFSSSALLAYDESRLSEDLQTLRQRVQDEIIQRAKDERPDAVEHLQELMRREDTQAMKMMYVS